MRRNVSLLAFLILSAAIGAQPVLSQSFCSDWQTTAFLQASPGAFDFGLLGFVNPANLYHVRRPELRIFWNVQPEASQKISAWGLVAARRRLGVGIVRRRIPGAGDAVDYRLSTAWGSEQLSFGLSYGGERVRRNTAGSGQFVSLAGLFRPNRFVSVGTVGRVALNGLDRTVYVDLGIRPLGSPALTLFADLAWQSGRSVRAAPWSAGLVWRPVSGIALSGRYFDDRSISVGIAVDLGHMGVRTLAGGKGTSRFSVHTVRMGGLFPSVFQRWQKARAVVPFVLKGRVDHLSYAMFDHGTHRLFQILQDIRASAADPRVALIAVNLSGMAILPEHAWEIRKELQRAQKSGKKVLVFLHDGDMTLYHLASVADRVVLDPQGAMQLRGYVMGRTFYKGTLEKLGLGFDEFRYFRYKSAMEVMSREQMSEADRQQRQAYVDDWYELVRKEICRSRGFSLEKFDALINKRTLFTAREALEAGLVDTLARWSQLEDVVKAFVGKKLKKLPRNRLMFRELPRQSWGRIPKIAVVYGLGVCDMDRGIRARWLEKVLLKLARRTDVKAVVFRVDSPGGDATASDVVAEALRKCREKKPVIVSQGQVAGSGGYWISMFGDTIVAGPLTVTGSIGVIGGWLYDRGFSRKLGMSADEVHRGEHADLPFGISIPFFGMIPSRGLTSSEKKRVQEFILAYYDEFVNKVAQGRNLPVDSVRSIAEGRFYSGIDGKTIGLVDELGNMMRAVDLARQKAGLRPQEETEFVEFPRSKGLFNPDVFFPGFFSKLKNDPFWQAFRMIGRSPGKPLPLMPLELILWSTLQDH
jgi:protease-4